MCLSLSLNDLIVFTVYWAITYCEPFQTSKMEVFCENSCLQGNKNPSLDVSAAVTGGVLLKKVFFEILQNSEENPCARVSFLLKKRL